MRLFLCASARWRGSHRTFRWRMDYREALSVVSVQAARRVNSIFIAANAAKIVDLDASTEFRWHVFQLFFRIPILRFVIRESLPFPLLRSNG
jgi:hypothetical protein